MVLVPGTFGTALYWKGTSVWPPRGLLGWLNLPRLLSLDVTPGEVLLKMPQGPGLPSFRPFEELIADLRARGHTEGEDLFLLGYDWRAPLSDSGKVVADLLRALPVDTPPVVIGHSMGTIVLRAALERHGAADRVHRAILVGPVDHGFPAALRALTGGHVFSTQSQGGWLQRLLSRLTDAFLSRQVHGFRPLFELIPDEPFVVSSKGLVDPREDLGWLRGDVGSRAEWLNAGRELLRELSGPPSVPTTYVYGASLPTAQRAWLRAVSTGHDWSTIQFWDGPGDGVISARAARNADLAARTSLYWSFEEHEALPSSLVVRELVRRQAAITVAEPAPLWVEAHVQRLRSSQRSAHRGTWTGREVVRLPVDGLHPAADVRALICSLRPGQRLLVHGAPRPRESAQEALWMQANQWEDADDPLPLLIELPGGRGPLGESGILQALHQRNGLGPDATPAEVSAYLQARPVAVVAIVRGASEAEALLLSPALAGHQTSLAILDPDRVAIGLGDRLERWARAEAPHWTDLFVSRQPRGPSDHVVVRVGAERLDEHTETGAERMAGDDWAVRSCRVPIVHGIDPTDGAPTPVRLRAVLRTKGFEPATRLLDLDVDAGKDGRAWQEAHLTRRMASTALRVWVEFYSGSQQVGALELPLYDQDGAWLDALTLGRLRQALVDAHLGEQWARATPVLPQDIVERVSSEPESVRVLRAIELLNGRRSEEGRTALASFIDRLYLLCRAAGPRQALLDALAELGGDVRIEPAGPFPETTFRPEAIVDTDDLLPASFVTSAVAAQDGVGCVEVCFDPRTAPSTFRPNGTGWMLTPRLMATCLHVFRLEGEADEELAVARAAASVLRFEDDGGNLRGRVRLAEVRFASAELDVAIVQLADRAAGERELPFLPWSSAAPEVSVGRDCVNIVQHPRGLERKVALRNNQLRGAGPIELVYTADTQPGSSGSPVFTDAWRVIGMHRKAAIPAVDLARQVIRYNVGVTLSAVMAAVRARDPQLWLELAPFERRG